MNEFQRLAYLEAMDIPTFVSRRDLPGAAPSRRVVLVKAAAPALPRAAPPTDPGKRKPEPEQAAATPAPRETPVFSLVAAEVGGWFWLDEIPAGREPGEDYAQLLLAICRALGLPASGAQVNRFSYPVNAKLAGGVEEAGQALYGFLAGRIADADPSGIVLLGDFAEPWFDRACLDGRRVVQSVSAWQMLRQPALKARAWTDLQPLRDDGG